MYKLSRLMLILSVAAGIWSLLIFALQLGGTRLHRDRRCAVRALCQTWLRKTDGLRNGTLGQCGRFARCRNARCQLGPHHRAGHGRWKAAIPHGNPGAFQLLGAVERSVRAVPGVDSAAAQSEVEPGIGADAEGRAYGGLRADGCWQGRLVRHSIPSGIRRVGGRGGLQRREFSADRRAQAEGVRPPDRRTRSVQIGFAGSADIQPIGLHRQGFADGH